MYLTSGFFSIEAAINNYVLGACRARPLKSWRSFSSLWPQPHE